ncbi:hypothetical protein VTI74DRAFT_9207 [Chaetomium olivicolor]
MPPSQAIFIAIKLIQFPRYILSVAISPSTMQAKTQQLVNSCLFKTEKDSGRRVKIGDCGSTTCPNSGSYVKPTDKSTSK